MFSIVKKWEKHFFFIILQTRKYIVTFSSSIHRHIFSWSLPNREKAKEPRQQTTVSYYNHHKKYNHLWGINLWVQLILDGAVLHQQMWGKKLKRVCSFYGKTFPINLDRNICIYRSNSHCYAIHDIKTPLINMITSHLNMITSHLNMILVKSCWYFSLASSQFTPLPSVLLSNGLIDWNSVWLSPSHHVSHLQNKDCVQTPEYWVHT